MVNSKKILNEFLIFVREIHKKDDVQLISYSFQINKIDSINVINQSSKNYNDIFFFRNPNNKLTLIGLNSAIEITTENYNQFSTTNEGIKYWQQNIICNVELNHPIICCAAKFDAVKNSKLWEDFKSIRVHIPEFIFVFENDNVIGFYNFTLDKLSDSKKLAKTFLEYLNKIQTLKAELSEQTYYNGQISLRSSREDFKDWQNIFDSSIKLMRDGRTEKLVLSREHSFKLSEPVCWKTLLNRLSDRFPDCYLFLLKQHDSFFFGSSPEMFLKVTGKIAEVESVAGSAPRGDKSESDSKFARLLQSSEKNHREHLFVSKFISEILFRYSDDVKVIEEKQIRKLDNIQHLITRISAILNSNDNLFDLIDSLFPTPAVCGVPKEQAMKFIRDLETHDRGLYSGIVGLLDFKNNCELAVSIRSALVKESDITAFAGAGLVLNSVCEEEFLETNLKLNTILSLFGNEEKSKSK